MPQLIFGQPRRATPFQAPFPRRQPEGNQAMAMLMSMMQGQNNPNAQMQTQISGQLALEALRQKFATQESQDDRSLLREQFKLQERAQEVASESSRAQTDLLKQQITQNETTAEQQRKLDKKIENVGRAGILGNQTQALYDVRQALSSFGKRELQDEFDIAAAGLETATSRLPQAWADYLPESENYEILSHIAQDAAGDIKRSAVEVTRLLKGSPAQAAAAFNFGQDMMSQLSKGGGSSIFFGIGGKGRANIWLDPEIVAFRSAMESQQTVGKIKEYNESLVSTQRNTELLGLEGLNEVLGVQISQSDEMIPGLEEALTGLSEKIRSLQDAGVRQQRSNLQNASSAPPSSIALPTAPVQESLKSVQGLQVFTDKDDELLKSLLATMQQ